MKKDIYSLLNETSINTENYDSLPITDEEVNSIMKKFEAQQSKTVTARKSHKKPIVFGIAAAAACFAGVIGVSVSMTGEKIHQGSSLISSENPGSAEEKNLSEAKVENSFFLTAAAAGIEDDANSSYCALEEMSGAIPFSGSIFSIRGNNIKSVSLSIDKGSLYKANFSRLRTAETTDSCEYIGNEYSEEYNDDRCFGFYFPEDVCNAHEQEAGSDIKEAWHRCYDDFDGGLLTVRVTYNDGSSDTTRYILSSGKLEVDPDTMQPNGNITNGDKPYVYGLLMTKEK
ncbi:MAG: hypothetical protein ACI4JB_07685 [Porcipelethomonas sp.]